VIQEERIAESQPNSLYLLQLKQNNKFMLLTKIYPANHAKTNLLKVFNIWIQYIQIPTGKHTDLNLFMLPSDIKQLKFAASNADRTTSVQYIFAHFLSRVNIQGN